MEFFDCNCALGIPGVRGLRFARNVTELQQEMDFCGIDRALVYHTAMRFDSPVIGNRLLMEEIEPDDRLVPVWTILPSQTDELVSPETFLVRMRQHGIRAVRAFPDEHRYMFDELTMGDWLALLEEKRVPLLLKTNPVKIAGALAAFPNLVVVAIAQGPHSLERYLRPIVERYAHFYIDTSSYMVDGLIEDFCAKYGAQHLLFGTGFPHNCSGASLLRLAQADIADEDKQAIAAGNLSRILQEAQL